MHSLRSRSSRSCCLPIKITLACSMASCRARWQPRPLEAPLMRAQRFFQELFFAELNVMLQAFLYSEHRSPAIQCCGGFGIPLHRIPQDGTVFLRQHGVFKISQCQIRGACYRLLCRTRFRTTGSRSSVGRANWFRRAWTSIGVGLRRNRTWYSSLM